MPLLGLHWLGHQIGNIRSGRPGSPRRLAGLVQGRFADPLPLCLLQLQLPQGPRHGAPWSCSTLHEALSCRSMRKPHFVELHHHLSVELRPNVCGPAGPRWAVHKDGVVMATAHCSKMSGSHSWPCTCEAHGPTYVQVAHAVGHYVLLPVTGEAVQGRAQA